MTADDERGSRGAPGDGRPDIRVSAVAFLRHAPGADGGMEVLTVRKHGTTLYQYPGGKPEPGEDPATAAVREVAEETGILLEPDVLEPVGRFTASAANEHGSTVTADLFLVATPASPVEPVVAAEIADFRWLPAGSHEHTPDDARYPLAPLMFTTFPRLVARATFPKHNPGRPGDWEEAGLTWLEEAEGRGGVPVAGVLGRRDGTDGRDDLLLRRVIPVEPTAEAAEEFGRRLAVTHACGAPAFGAGPDGWSGGGYQGPNDHLLELPLTPCPTWGRYYADVVLGPLERAVPGGVAGTSDLTGRLRDGDFDDGRAPSRLHGDLWSGNLMWSAQGATVIDPSAHGGHGLTDLGFLTMFGAPYLDTILGAYAESSGLGGDWRELLPLHRLHVLYLHAAVFGGGYVTEAERTVRQVLAL